jgi:hypothetical protein
MLGGDDLGGGYGLAYVALSVLSDVDKQAANGGWPALSADLSCIAQSSGIESANSFDALFEGCTEFGKKLTSSSATIEFAS